MSIHRPAQKDNHYCFDVNTIVYCKNGNKNLKDVKIGDFVLTPIGYKKVLNNSNYLTDAILYTFDDKNNIISTENHPFFNQGGLTPISNCGDILWRFSSQESIVFLMVKSIVGMVCIGRRLVDMLTDANGYIKQFMNIIYILPIFEYI